MLIGNKLYDSAYGGTAEISQFDIEDFLDD